MKEAILGYEELQCDIVLLVVGYFFCLIAHWCRGVKTQPHKVIHLTALCIHYSTQCTAIHLTLIAPQLFKSSFLCSAHADHCRLSSRLRGKRARPRFFSAEDSRYEMFTYWPWELIHVSADKNVLRIPCGCIHSHVLSFAPHCRYKPRCKNQIPELFRSELASEFSYRSQSVLALVVTASLAVYVLVWGRGSRLEGREDHCLPF